MKKIQPMKHYTNQGFEEKLDKILKTLREFSFQKNIGNVVPITVFDIFIFTFHNHPFDEIIPKDYYSRFDIYNNNSEPHLYLKHLLKDGLVDEINNKYKINLNGVLFINNGGYTFQHKLTEIKISNEKRKEKGQKINSWAVIILSIISVATAIWTTYLTYVNNDKDKRLYDLENSIKNKDNEIDLLKQNLKHF